MTFIPRIAIVIITFCRPDSLAQTLHSLAAMILPAAAQVQLIVVDNDAAKSAYPVVEAIKSTLPFPVEYVVEAQRGIPYARNCALEKAASVEYLAFIDDDDKADANWLCALYDAMQTYSADVVKGRMIYHFPEGKEYLHRLDIFAPDQRKTGDELQSAWTGNVLFSTKIYQPARLRFDSRFSRSGGSDHHFFCAAKHNGAKIIMCREAIIYTDVPLQRTRWQWLARRNFRIGATLTISDIQSQGYKYAFKQLKKALPDSARYAYRLLPRAGTDRHAWLHPTMVACFMLGRVTGLLQLAPREY